MSHSDHTPAIRWAMPDDRPAALACYERNGYHGGIAPEDRALLAVRGKHVVGCVRLCPENDAQVLRGFFIDAPEQGRGLGKRMLATLAEAMAATCWLICGSHLRGFYAYAQFEEVAPDQALPHLAARAAGYAEKHGPQSILRRSAPQQ